MKLKFGLLFFCFFCECSSFTIDQVYEQSAEKGLDNLSQLKRQLHDMDEDPREIMVNKDNKFEEKPVPTRRTVSADKKSSSEIVAKNCTCDVHKKMKVTPEILKYLAELTKYIGYGTMMPEETLVTESTTTTLRPTPTSSGIIPRAHINDTKSELQSLEFQLDAAMREVCHHYKDIPDLDMDSMADVWQLVYYKAPETLTCFKIYLKKISPQARKRFQIKYTNFNNTIDWEECHLELASTGRYQDDRRHFLQGAKADKGVLENIILAQGTENNTKTITLLDHAPDQWLVTNNLLLMRDCDTGDIAIFMRVPSDLEKHELLDAMALFGEAGMNGTLPCRVSYENKMKELKRTSTKYYNKLLS